MGKKLIKESAVRQFMKLAGTKSLAEEFVRENYEEEDEQLAEDNFDKSGPGPHREGAGKSNPNGESGVATDQGKNVPDSPSGKLEIPGTSYEKDHKLSNTTASKKSINGGTSLAENYDEEEGLEGDEESEMAPPAPEAPGMDAGMGDEMAPPMGEPDGDEGMGMGGESEELLKKVVNAVASALGVAVSIDGEEAMGGEMDAEMPPMDDMPAPGVDAAPPAPGGEEMPPMGDEEDEFQDIATEALVSELEKRGAIALEEEAPVEEGAEDAALQEAITNITKRVATKLLKKKKKK